MNYAKQKFAFNNNKIINNKRLLEYLNYKNYLIKTKFLPNGVDKICRESKIFFLIRKTVRNWIEVKRRKKK